MLGFDDEDDEDESLSPYIIFKWHDWVKMIRERRETWWDGILLEPSLYHFDTLGREEMETWLEYFASRYLRVGKMYDVLVPKESPDTLK